MEQVAQRIKDRTNGAVEIETYGSGQLAVYKDNLQQVVDGANWIACEDPSYLADYNIDFEALIAPMLYTNLQQYSYVCQSDVVKQMCQDIEDNYGIHVLALDFNVGLRCMQTNKEIKTPDDEGHEDPRSQQLHVHQLPDRHGRHPDRHGLLRDHLCRAAGCCRRSRGQHERLLHQRLR